MGNYSQLLDLVAWGYHSGLRAIMATALLAKAKEKIVVESPLTIFVLHAVEALLNSHHTQYFSASCLTSYEVLLLTAMHITLYIVINLTQLLFFPPSLTKSLMTA